jgi:hypothetical protein
MNSETSTALDRILLGETTQKATTLRAANELGDAIVARDGRAADLGEFTLAMHGFWMNVDLPYSRSIEGVEVKGATIEDEATSKVVERHISLVERFGDDGDRWWDSEAIARISPVEEVDHNYQITAIGVIPTTRINEEVGNLLEYRIKRVKRLIDEKRGKAQHGYEGTVELNVVAFRNFEDASASADEKKIVLAGLTRTRSSLTLHGKEGFYADIYEAGLDNILEARSFELRRNANAKGDLLFMKRAIAAKRLAVSVDQARLEAARRS